MFMTPTHRFSTEAAAAATVVPCPLAIANGRGENDALARRCAR
jgi:hypothetical protein